jgi:DNA polymerase III delta prime subunit
VASPAQAGCRAQDAQNALRRAMEAHSKVTPAQARACAQDAQNALRRTMEAHSTVTP